MQQNAYIEDQPRENNRIVPLYNDATAVVKARCEYFGFSDSLC